MMETLFASGHAADIVLGVLAIEALILARRGWAFTAIIGLGLAAGRTRLPAASARPAAQAARHPLIPK